MESESCIMLTSYPPPLGIFAGVPKPTSYVFTSKKTGVSLTVPTDKVKITSEVKLLEYASSIIELFDGEFEYK